MQWIEPLMSTLHRVTKLLVIVFSLHVHVTWQKYCDHFTMVQSWNSLESWPSLALSTLKCVLPAQNALPGALPFSISSWNTDMYYLYSCCVIIIFIKVKDNSYTTYKNTIYKYLQTFVTKIMHFVNTCTCEISLSERITRQITRGINSNNIGKFKEIPPL